MANIRTMVISDLDMLRDLMVKQFGHFPNRAVSSWNLLSNNDDF